jgi:hypothetical protein
MKIRGAFVPAAVLLTLPLILYFPLLIGSKVLYWGVILLQFYPWRKLAVEQIRSGHWPLWNPYLGAGTPLAANLQTAAFYPPNILFLLMPVERAFGWELALHVTLAGVFAYCLGRTLGLSPFGALVGGLAYGGGGYIVSHSVFPSMVYAAAWLPLMLAFTERLVRRPFQNSQSKHQIGYWFLDVALLSATVALQLLAGHAQTSFYSLVSVAFFALFRLAQRHAAGDRPRRIRPLLLSAGALFLSALGGIALAAIQLLPSAELAAHSQRAGTLTDMTFAYELSFWPWRFITLLAPDFFGHPARNEYWGFGNYWEGAAFIGILPLLLAVLALIRWWQKRAEARLGLLSAVPFFALLSLVSLILALGHYTPLYPFLFQHVPGFGLFQAPARLTIGYALGMAVLAGIGAESLSLTPRLRSLIKILLIVGLGIIIGAIAARLILPGIQPSFVTGSARLGLTLALACGLLLVRGCRLGGHRLRREHWQPLVVAFIFVELLAFGWGLTPGTDPAIYQTAASSSEFLWSQPPGRIHVAQSYASEVYDQYVSLHSFGPSEPAYLRALRESQLPNQYASDHLYGVGNYDPLTIGLYRDLWDRIDGKAGTPPDLDEVLPLLNLFGARYIVSDDELPLPEIYGAGPRIYRNDSALPYAFVVYQARVVEDRAMRLRLLLDPTFNPRAEVLLSTTPAPAVARETETGSDETDLVAPTILREGPQGIQVQVSMPRSGYLVLTDAYYPGWKATVDGHPAEILPANHAFRAVALGKGEHTVAFEYEPYSFSLGLWITAGVFLLLAAVLVAGWLLSKKHRTLPMKDAPCKSS